MRGIGPCYMDKTGRNGLRVGDLFRSNFEHLYKSLKEKHLQFIKQFPDVEFDLKDQEKLDELISSTPSDASERYHIFLK